MSCIQRLDKNEEAELLSSVMVVAYDVRSADNQVHTDDGLEGGEPGFNPPVSAASSLGILEQGLTLTCSSVARV